MGILDHVSCNRPYQVGDEREHVLAAIAADHSSGSGMFTERCERAPEDRLGAA